jgi:uncharacterized protein YggE
MERTRGILGIAAGMVLLVSLANGQIAGQGISISGDAEVKVAPDRVTLVFGVETRDKDLEAATSRTDVLVRQVMAAARQLSVDNSDIQTDYIRVDMSYNDRNPTIVEYYTATKSIQIFLKDVSKFEPLLHAAIAAGANHIYGVDFSTSELRKYRDQARALAAKAALEKASDLAAAAGLKVVGKPLSVSSYSYGGGFLNACCGYRYGGAGGFAQNVVQNVGGSPDLGAGASVALGKISVTASVTMTFQIQ